MSVLTDCMSEQGTPFKLAKLNPKVHSNLYNRLLLHLNFTESNLRYQMIGLPECFHLYGRNQIIELTNIILG